MKELDPLPYRLSKSKIGSIYLYHLWNLLKDRQKSRCSLASEEYIFRSVEKVQIWALYRLILGIGGNGLTREFGLRYILTVFSSCFQFSEKSSPTLFLHKSWNYYLYRLGIQLPVELYARHRYGQLGDLCGRWLWSSVESLGVRYFLLYSLYLPAFPLTRSTGYLWAFISSFLAIALPRSIFKTLQRFNKYVAMSANSSSILFL